MELKDKLQPLENKKYFISILPLMAKVQIARVAFLNKSNFVYVQNTNNGTLGISKGNQ